MLASFGATPADADGSGCPSDDSVAPSAADGASKPRVGIVYRSCAKENARGRPAFYSKRVALLSLLRAAAESDVAVDIVFVNDGRLSQDLLDHMHRAGRVITHQNLGIKGSYRRAVSLAASDAWDADDLVYLVEDDYLWRPDSLRNVARAAAQLSPGAYLTSYATPLESPAEDGTRSVDGRPWIVADSCCSTLAARRRVWRADRWIHWLAPIARGNWDRTVNLTVRGEPPFDWRQLVREAVARPYSVRHLRATFPRLGARVVLSFAALTRRHQPRPLYVPAPEDATHLMLPPMLAEGTDWEAVARDAELWAEKQAAGFDR
jgi:hypothetical protein